MVDYIKGLDLAFSRLIYRVRLLHNRYTADEITDTQFIVLRSLRKEPRNTSFLAGMLGVTLSAVTALINRLCKMGLVTRERSGEDRRQVWITITAIGLKTLEDVEDRRNLLLALYLQKVPAEKRKQLLSLLNDLVCLFENEDVLNDETDGSRFFGN